MTEQNDQEFTPYAKNVSGNEWRAFLSDDAAPVRVFCRADASTEVDALAIASGSDVTQEQIDAMDRREKLSAITEERDRRVNGGFVFDGVTYQTRPEDRENMAGAATSALAAMTGGATAGDYRWHGGDTDFAWIAADNSLHPMDAQTMFAFGQAAMRHKQALIFAARQLKDMAELPDDITADEHWPA